MATARVGAVLAHTTGADELSRIRTWTADTQTLNFVRQQFDLNDGESKQLFLNADATVLEQRQHINLALRWCPDCLARWYHCAHFQDRRVRYCPWHRVRLRETCPHCARAVDPLGRPWRCDYCSKPLVADPERWLSGFKTAPGHDGHWPQPLPKSMLAYEEMSHGVLCRPDGDGEGTLDAHRHALDYWHNAQLYESAAALWDTVLRQHRSCALEEPYGYGAQYYNLEFNCPVAAAARAVFGQMALNGAMRGAWPVRMAVAYGMLPAPGAVSLEVRKAMMRELPRAWLADSLLLFGEIARTGRTSGRWEPHPQAFHAKAFPASGSNGAEIVTKRPENWLRASTAFCGELCVKRKTEPGSWDALQLLLA